MDFEGFLVVATIVALGIIVSFVGILLGGMALSQIGVLRKNVGHLRMELETLRRRQPEVPPVPGSAAGTAEFTPPAPHQAAPSEVAQPVAAAPPMASHATAATHPPTPVAHEIPAPPSAQQAATARILAPQAPRMAWAATAAARREKELSDLESQIGQRWIAWVGAIVVFLSVVFFLKYAFQNNWIGPTGQVVISALGGAALAAAGSYYIGRKWRIFGQCLMGLGLAILYAAFFAAFKIYDPPVMGQTPAFGLMIAVTIAGMTLAVLHDALSMAFLAVLGGILTPALISTGQDSRDTLFAYLLILDLGVLGVAFFKNWRLLDTLAMAGTFIFYMGWWAKFYTPAGIWPAMAWLGAIYLVFLILPFVYHLVRRQAVTVERFIMAMANAAFAASYAYAMMRAEYLFTMGFISLAMAGAYLVLGVLLRKRVPADMQSLFGAITLAVTFITLAVPMQLHAHGILLAWVAEAPVLASLAYRFKYAPLRALAFLVLVVGVGRLFLSEVHWPLHHEAFVPFANKQFLSAMAVPAAAWVYAAVHQMFRKDETPLDRGLKLTAALGGGILALVILNAEVHGWLKDSFDSYGAFCGMTALWALGTFAYLASARFAVRAAPLIWGTATFTLAAAAMLGVATYDESTGAAHVLFGNGRFAACLLVVAAGFTMAWEIHRNRKAGSPENQFSVLFFIAGLLGLLLLLSTEVYTYCHDVIADEEHAGRAGQMAITLVWSVYAAGLLWAGFWRRWRPLRWAALALFGLSALKLVLMDLTFLKDIYRIVAFLVLGVLMLAASYLYHRLEKRLMGSAASRDESVPEGEAAEGEIA